MVFTCASRTHVGLRRKLNEDAYLSQPRKGLWVVADGMGGHEAGEVASGMIVDALDGLPFDPMQYAEAALKSVNTALVRLAARKYHERTIGSTVVVLMIAEHAYRCMWVGDSRAYLYRDGQIRQLTRDHSLVQDLVDAGMLDANEAEGHPNANVVTRAVGAHDTLRVDSMGDAMQPGDIFLLASDGLTRVVPNEELAVILGHGTLEQMADELLRTTLDRGAPDNVTMVLVST